MTSTRGTTAAGTATRIASAALAACVAFAACATPAPPPLPHAVRPVIELARWRVWAGAELAGTLRQLEIRDPSGPIVFYRVEDTQGRWLGHATREGRFSRRVPFATEEQDLGVWSLERGVRELVDADTVRLEPVAVDADARRSDR